MDEQLAQTRSFVSSKASTSESDFYEHHKAAQNIPYYELSTKHNYFDEPDTKYLDDELDYEIVTKHKPLDGFVPPSLREDAPLGSVLNPDLDKIDPRIWFPDFSPNETPRFSRLLMGNQRPPNSDVWWTSKTPAPVSHKLAKMRREREEAVRRGEIKQESTLHALNFANNISMKINRRNDDAYRLMQPIEAETKHIEQADTNINQFAKAAPWRFGPAKSVYDFYKVPIDAQTLDYGARLPSAPPDRDDLYGKIITAEKSKSRSKKGAKDDDDIGLDNDYFLPVNTMNWENDVALESSEVRDQLANMLSSAREPCWIITQHTRSFESYLNLKTVLAAVLPNSRGYTENEMPGIEQNAFASIMPQEFTEVETDTTWENEIIFSPFDLKRNIEPRILAVDINDSPLLYGMPEDVPKSDDKKSKKDNATTKKSKMILGQVQQRRKQEQEEQMECEVLITDKDPFNLSSEDYYTPKAVVKSAATVGSVAIQHSIPAQDLHLAFFPPHLGPNKLRHFHRPVLGKSIVLENGAKYMPIKPLTKYIKYMNEVRERKLKDQGEVFMMRTVEDLSIRDGSLLLLEYSEEHPPLISQPGMASKIRNYYKRKGKEHEPLYEFGETAYSHGFPFLGQLQPSQSLQSIENNLFRAPIYQHKAKSNDFLLIYSSNGWNIRGMPPLFVVGQECPLYEVPSPNSKRANQFVRDSLMAFIFRLFLQSNDNPRRLRIEELKEAFPHYADSSLRKRLKVCADFRRLGNGGPNDSTFWVLRQDYRLPSVEEIRAMVTPEMYCAQYSMLASEQRLRDAGYGEVFYFVPDNDDSDDDVTMEEELKAAPWNTTRAYMAAIRGKCLLDQTGIADPTGCGQGFSYIRVSAKPPKEDGPTVPKRHVTGTNADLRKLPLKEAKKICSEYGVRDDEINALSRWEIIDVIRTLSTQAARASGDSSEMSGMARFARGTNRFNVADVQEKFKRYCQRIFDIQNQVLSNVDELSTDEESISGHSDDEALANTVETMLKQGTDARSSKARARQEREEEERRELLEIKRMVEGLPKTAPTAKKEEPTTTTAEQTKRDIQRQGEEVVSNASKIRGITGTKKLKIYRKIKEDDGTERETCEIVTRPQLIEAYVKIRSYSEDFIRSYAISDDSYKNERNKEKRKIQDQLRRIKRFQDKTGKSSPSEQSPKKEPGKARCSACNTIGHVRTNRSCPLFGKDPATLKKDPIAVVSSNDNSNQPPVLEPAISDADLLEGIKIKLKRVQFNAEEAKQTPSTSTADKMSTALSMPNIDDLHSDDSASRSSQFSKIIGSKRRASALTLEESEYLHGPAKSVHRIRADPKVTMGTIFNDIINDLRSVDGIDPLLKPVNSKAVKDYYDIVKEPMDIQQIKQKIQDNKYETRMDFLGDMKKMLDNSLLYNGPGHPITVVAQKVVPISALDLQVFELTGKRIIEREEQLVALEKRINPLLDDNDRVGFSYILTKIVQDLKNIPKSAAFHTKVDARKVPTYYDRIEKPMDLSIVEQKALKHEYLRVEDFRDDVRQILENSTIFNGAPEVNAYSAKAKEIVDKCESLLDQQAEYLGELQTRMGGGRIINDDEFEEELVEDDLTSTGEQEQEERARPKFSLNSPSRISESEEDMDHEMDLDEVPSVQHEGFETAENTMDAFDAAEFVRPTIDPSAIALGLEQSDMQVAGQLIADLDMSSSDEDEAVEDAKRPNYNDEMSQF